MPNSIRINIEEWVESAKGNPELYRRRQMTDITPNAIARTESLNEKVFLKGGTLMGVVYKSPRQTVDVDLTAAEDLLVDDIENEIAELLDSEFRRVTAMLGYPKIVVKTQKVTRKPKGGGKSFPALELKIASAQRGTPQETQLSEGKAASVIKVEISFSEPSPQIQVLELTDGQWPAAYSLVDLIAEKYRALLQQPQRNRYRRQDVYDLNWLIEHTNINKACRTQILDAFVKKCAARYLKPTRSSLDNLEIKERAGAEWETMKLELGELPDFERCFARVSEFYRSLPWGSK